MILLFLRSAARFSYSRVTSFTSASHGVLRSMRWFWEVGPSEKIWKTNAMSARQKIAKKYRFWRGQAGLYRKPQLHKANRGSAQQTADSYNKERLHKTNRDSHRKLWLRTANCGFEKQTAASHQIAASHQTAAPHRKHSGFVSQTTAPHRKHSGFVPQTTTSHRTPRLRTAKPMASNRKNDAL